MSVRSPWLLVCLLAASVAYADLPEDLVPDKAVVADVRAFGARCDGATDDSDAFQAAFSAAGQLTGRPRVVRVPAGRCVISRTIRAFNADASGNLTTQRLRTIGLQGAGRTRSVVVLRPSAPGFGDAAAPRAMIEFSSDPANMNGGFHNFVEDLALHYGPGNPGAVALDWVANNVGAIRRVSIAGPELAYRCAVGIRMTRGQHGPDLLDDVSVSGCDVGIDLAQLEGSTVLDRVSVARAAVASVRNQSGTLSARRLRTAGPGPGVLLTAGASFATVVDSQLLGGPAVVNQRGGHFLLRNVSTDAGLISEQATSVLAGLADDRSGSLRLPWQDPPAEFTSTSLADWAFAADFGATTTGVGPKNDDSPAIQAALDSGRPIVAINGAFFDAPGALRVPCSVRTLIGYSAQVQASATGGLRIAPCAQPLTIRRLWFGSPGNPAAPYDTVRIDSGRAVVLRDVTGGTGGRVVVGANARAWFDDIAVGALEIAPGAAVWARQLNTETKRTEPYHVLNAGGRLAVLGYKTELAQTFIDARAGAQVEVLGGFLFPLGFLPDPSLDIPTDLPMLRVTDSCAFFSLNQLAIRLVRPDGSVRTNFFTTLLEERRAGATGLVLRSQAPARGAFGSHLSALSACP